MSGFKIVRSGRQLVATLIVNLLTMPLGIIFSWIITKFPILLIQRILHGNNFIPTDDEPTMSSGIAFAQILPFIFILSVLPIIVYISEHFGRRPALAISTIPFVLCILTISTAKNFIWILAAMNLGAVACAMQLYLVPMYVYEISDRRRSGAHGVIRTLFMGIGFCIGYFQADIWSNFMHVIITLMLTVIFLIGLNYLPESPVWLARVKKASEAKSSSASLQIDHGSESSFGFEDVTYIEELGYVPDADFKFKRLIEEFEISEILRGFIVSTFLLIGQAIVQINIVGAFFLTTAGMEIWIADRSQVILINILIHIVICVIMSLVIDRIGRRILLIISCTSMLITVELLSGLWMLFPGIADEYSSLFHTIFSLLAMIYSISYTLGIGSMPSILAVEATPLHVVPYAYAVSTAIFWIATWMMGEVWESVDWSTEIIPWCFGQAIICLLLLIFVCLIELRSQKKLISPSQNLFHISNGKLCVTPEVWGE